MRLALKAQKNETDNSTMLSGKFCFAQQETVETTTAKAIENSPPTTGGKELLSNDNPDVLSALITFVDNPKKCLRKLYSLDSLNLEPQSSKVTTAAANAPEQPVDCAVEESKLNECKTKAKAEDDDDKDNDAAEKSLKEARAKCLTE